MVYQSRTRRRVHAIRRGPDGSAFEKCECCGVSVAIALADMHECESKKNVKKLKGGQSCQCGNVTRQRIQDQPRSAFRFFMEEFVRTCDGENEIDIDRRGFETWKKMSKQETQPFVLQAETVNSAHTNALLKEENDNYMSLVEDEADSAEVGKYDKNYEEYDYGDDSDNSDSYGIFWSESENLECKLWATRQPWMVEKS